MQHPEPQTHSDLDELVWPPVAVPGKPGRHTGEDCAADGVQGALTDEPAVEAAPDPEPTVGAEVLDELRGQLAKFVILPSPEALDAVTLWVAATHLQTAWQHAPRLAVVGPAKRCGKSRLLDVLTETVHDPLITVNASAAAVFRSITDVPPTLLVDEADTLFGSAKVAEKNEEMRGLLNAGHQRNRPTLRVSGPNHEVAKFPTFAMAALAGIGDLPDTIMDRSVVIRMRRRGPGEKVAEFRTVRDTPALHALRDRLAAWLTPLHATAMDLTPPMPVEDRAADTWEPLIAIADLAGGTWPAAARAACLAMTRHEVEQDQDNSALNLRLLADIRRAFAAEGNPALLRTGRLLGILNEDTESPWPEYKDKGLSARGVQLLLKGYGISPSSHRFPDGFQARGFAREQFADAWARYCPEPAPAAEPPLLPGPTTGA